MPFNRDRKSHSSGWNTEKNLFDEKIVGMHVLGIGSDELMQGFGVAMNMGCRKAGLDSCVVTMGVWDMSLQESGARVSPLGGAAFGGTKISWVENGSAGGELIYS